MILVYGHLKPFKERNVVIDNYYSFILQSRPLTTVFNVPRQAGKKPGQQRKRTSSRKTQKKNHQYYHYELNKN